MMLLLLLIPYKPMFTTVIPKKTREKTMDKTITKDRLRKIGWGPFVTFTFRITIDICT